MCENSVIIIICVTFITILIDSCILGDIATNVVNDLGYPIERHGIETSDGFKIILHRIPFSHNKTEEGQHPSKIVLLVHGILCSSTMWVTNMNNNNATSLAFMLSDDGYDVWMLNVRGTLLSKEHKKMDVDDPKYWDFSWHEMGMEDVPSAIDYILHKTKKQKLNYICHSQGCTALLVTLSMKHEYNSKIAFAYLLSPAAFMTYISGVIPNALRNQRDNRLFSTLQALGLHAIQPRNNSFSNLVKTICFDRRTIELCSEIMANMIGVTAKKTDKQLLRFLFKYVGDNSSIKQFTHFIQLMRSSKFQMFDYGQTKNNELYLGDTPLDYNLTTITTPISILRTTNDPLSTKKDIKTLTKQLPNTKSLIVLPGNHIDYIFDPITITAIKNHMLNVMENNI